MKGSQEYEVESITKARVHNKRGNKITWRYYVKWKGYDWDENTWEPADSFQGGSEHILECFWDRMDTGGRDFCDASAFKKGEELIITGPPGRKPLKKRKANPETNQVSSPSKDVSSSNSAIISAPLSSSQKRRRVQPTANDERGHSKRRAPTGLSKNGEIFTRPFKRRTVSSPGPRKSASKRLPSVGDSQLDADGETDPDAVEVEDELMQVSAGDIEEDTTGKRYPATSSGIPNGPKKIAFDDLEHFYSGHPIDIDQNPDEQLTVQKPENRPLQSRSPATDSAAPELQAPASPAVSSYNPLFDSPSPSSNKVLEIQRDLPPHRARVAKPLVKLIEPTTIESTSKQSRITAKARLMSVHATAAPSTSGPSRGGKPGPGRSSSGLITRHRSSLLTVTKGALKSVAGKFASTVERDQPDEIEEFSDGRGTSGGNQTTLDLQPTPPPSGDELLRLAGLKAETDPEPLPDYEDEPAAQPQKVGEMQISKVDEAPVDEALNRALVKVTEESKASDYVADTPPSISEAGQRALTPVIDNFSISSVVVPEVDEAVKKNIELAKEHLFPSTQSSFDSFSTTQSSFRSTIFGPLYQGTATNGVPVTQNELSTTFKVILGDGIELPLSLKDCNEMQARIGDITVGNSSGKVALFYSAEDALAMVSTLKSDGTARVVLDPTAEVIQQERFSTLLQRFQSSHTLIAPVGKEVCVLYSSENTSIAEKLGAPSRLRGLSSTLLISHASIENQLAYVGAIMRATAL